MPVTIHYNGKLDDRARLAELLDAARLYCAEHRWMYRDIEETIVGHVERIATSEAGAEPGETVRVPINDTLQGVLITPHVKADPLWFTFNNAGYLISYLPLNESDEYWERASLLVDTQFAGVVPAHIAICEFLEYIRANYMPVLNVYDETNYFESGDVLRVERAMDDSTENQSFYSTSDPSEQDDSNESITNLLESGADRSETPRKKKSPVARGSSVSKSTSSVKRT